MKHGRKWIAGAFLTIGCLTPWLAQDAQPARGGRAGAPSEMWLVEKTRKGVYNPPMRPLWKLSDLKRMHAGQDNAIEGDVLYAAPMGWHQMGAEAPSGPSVRLAMAAYPLINMHNTEG